MQFWNSPTFEKRQAKFVIGLYPILTDSKGFCHCKLWCLGSALLTKIVSLRSSAGHKEPYVISSVSGLNSVARPNLFAIMATVKWCLIFVMKHFAGVSQIKHRTLNALRFPKLVPIYLSPTQEVLKIQKGFPIALLKKEIYLSNNDKSHCHTCLF